MSSIVGPAEATPARPTTPQQGGLIGLTKSLAKGAAARKDTVNAVAPGFIDTE